MKNFRLLSLAVLLTATTLSCSKLSDLVNPKTEGIAPEAPSLKTFGSVTPESSMGLVRVAINLQSFVPGDFQFPIAGFEIPPIDYTTAIGKFGEPGADIGEVSVNVANADYLLEKLKNNNSTTYTYTGTADFGKISGSETALGIPLNTTGDIGFTMKLPADKSLNPSSTANVILPAQVKITNITEGQTLKKADGVNVEFSAGNANFFGAIVIDTKGNTTELKTGNTKKFSFSSSDLSNLKGDILVYGIAVNYKASQDKKTVVFGESVGLKNAKLE